MDDMDDFDVFDIPIGRGHRVYKGNQIRISAGNQVSFLLCFSQPGSSDEDEEIRFVFSISESERECRTTTSRLLDDVTAAWQQTAFEICDNPRAVLPAIQPIMCSVRHGLECSLTLSDNDSTTLVDTDRFLTALEQVGHALCSRLPRAHAAVNRWIGRAPVRANDMQSFQAELLGLEYEAVGGLGIPMATSKEDLIYPDDLETIARRLQGRSSNLSIRIVLDIIRQHPHCSTAALDEMGILMNDAIPIKSGMLPHEHGRRCALWLRRHWSLVDQDVLDMHARAGSLGIAVNDVELNEDVVDAIAAWGGHGPVIVVNTSGRNSILHGADTGIAHMLCHMLLDRSHALPVSDVYGAHMRLQNDTAEERANAFAQELLRPNLMLST